VSRAATAEGLHEPQRNAELRRLDWRFLLRLPDQPGDVDLVALRRAGRAELAGALAFLRPGGEVRCEWRLAVPGAARRARRALERAGFEDVRVHWAWPPARRTPQFWIPLDEPAAAAHLFGMRPPANRRGAVARRLWRIAASIGVLTPLSVIGRKPGGGSPGGDEIEALLDGLPGDPGSHRAWLLLTGGGRSINKVVGLPFEAAGQAPRYVVKFARVAEAEAGLEREASMLRTIEAERPALPGVPHLLASGRRVGRLAIAETAIDGRPLLSALTPRTFPELAMKLNEWLISLAGNEKPRPRSEWWARLMTAPLEGFEQRFAPVAEAGTPARARELLERLPDLPLVCEHRDCSPWNVLLTANGEPALLDWESAEPHGLPGLDLVYFLANAAFVIEGALESGRTLEAYARLLDPTSSTGQVFARCVSLYCDRLHLTPETLAHLRSLCWIVHSRSDYSHLEMDTNAPPDPNALRSSLYLGLLQEDLHRWEDAS
jgi:Phosphotransferase enzyme family